MKWSTFLEQLDSFRAKIRATRNTKEGTVAPDDTILEELVAFLNQVTVGRTSPEATEDHPCYLDTATAPFIEILDGPKAEEPSTHVVSRGEGEGQMVVPARKNKPVPKPPVLEEVTEDAVEDK